MEVAQFVDPAVSRTKFEREIDEFKALEPEYRGRGWLMVKADYPEVLVILATSHLKPPALVTGVLFNYTNYDAVPPSVRLVDPFSGQPYEAGNLPTVLKRTVDVAAPDLGGMVLPQGAQARMVAQQPLMQAYGPEDIPFLCLAGVREYHEHPGHSGDSWELHRKAGAGRIVRLLEVISKYGLEPITDYQVSLEPRITGFIQNQAPE